MRHLILIVTLLFSVSTLANTPFNFETGEKLIGTSWKGSMKLTPETPSEQFTDISGYDYTIDSPSNWDVDLEQSQFVRDSRIWYEAGVLSEREAKIVNAPRKAGSGKMLRFRIKDGNIRKNGIAQKGRIQHGLNNVTGIKEFYYKTQIFLPGSMGKLRQYPDKFTFFTIAEFWNNQGHVKDPFRITVAIHKVDKTVGAPLRFAVHGQELKGDSWWEGEVWDETNSVFEIPTNKLVTLEYYVKEGGEPYGTSPNGRFKLVATPAGESPQTIFDISRTTRHRLQGTDGHSPINGYDSLQVHKLYVGADIINYMKDLGRNITIYYGDFEFWYK